MTQVPSDTGFELPIQNIETQEGKVGVWDDDVAAICRAFCGYLEIRGFDYYRVELDGGEEEPVVNQYYTWGNYETLVVQLGPLAGGDGRYGSSEAPKFFNVWLAKVKEDDVHKIFKNMIGVGNGFAHVSIRNIDDMLRVLSAIELAR